MNNKKVVLEIISKNFLKRNPNRWHHRDSNSYTSLYIPAKREVSIG